MNTALEFVFNILSGIVANKASKALEADRQEEAATDTAAIHDDVPLQSRFRTFDSSSDLEGILRLVNAPTAHIITEETPSNFYHLSTVVIEDRDSGAWYVFHRGRFSFESDGGGRISLKELGRTLKMSNAVPALWTASKESLDKFEKGYLLWDEFKRHLIPFIANVQKDEWDLIKERMLDFIQKSQ